MILGGPGAGLQRARQLLLSCLILNRGLGRVEGCGAKRGKCDAGGHCCLLNCKTSLGAHAIEPLKLLDAPVKPSTVEVGQDGNGDRH